jgi:hypothetical protein
MQRAGARRHPHGQVLPLDIGRADVLWVGAANHRILTDADTGRQAVTLLGFTLF